MADQFCRIVNTTVTDATLGSDVEQSVLTTDANTSFVVRATCATSSSTDTKLCSNLVPTMDGHVMDSTKSFIVPPESNLCVKDTSGNYPLKYSCLELHGHMCANFCGTCNPVIGACTVNNIVSGTPTVDNQIACCACCNIYNSPDSFDMHFFTTNRLGLVHIRHDGNSNHCLRIYQAGCSQPKYDNGTSYCPAVVSGGLVAVGGNCCASIFNPEACSKVNQTQYQCCKTMCNFLQDYDPTSYSRIGLSGQEHPTCEACRALVMWKGGAVTCRTSFFTFNICETGPSINSTLIFCINNNNIRTASDQCTQFAQMANSSVFLGAYYSARCSKFVAVAYHCSCVSFGIENGSADSVLGINQGMPGVFGTSSPRILVSQGKMWAGQTTNCQFVSVDLDDIMENGSTAKVTCYFGYPCHNCMTPGGSVVAMQKSFDSPDPTNFAINPTTKFSMYGIKST